MTLKHNLFDKHVLYVSKYKCVTMSMSITVGITEGIKFLVHNI